MKKSVVILIAVIYIASILLVTFFGLEYNTFFEDVKVAEITITNDGVRYTKDGQKYIVIPAGDTEFQIEYSLTPDEATVKEVDFIYDTQQSYVTVDENGLVTFSRTGSVTVEVRAADGSGASDKIIVAKLK